MDRDQFRKKSRTLDRLAHFQLLYSIFTLILSVPTTFLGIALLRESMASMVVGDPTFGAVTLGLGIYGLVAAAAMMRARTELVVLSHTAIRWTRFALLLAVPGSILMGVVGAFLIMLDHWVTLGLGIGLLAGTVLNVTALVRGGFSDLDDVLWLVEASRQRIEGLNYDEN